MKRDFFFLERFLKNVQISHFTIIPLVGAELFHADRRTDMKKLIVALRNVPNVSNLKKLIVALRNVPNVSNVKKLIVALRNVPNVSKTHSQNTYM